jgi:hypothetical protein
MAADPERQELHRLVDELDDGAVEELRRLARRFRDLNEQLRRIGDPMFSVLDSAPPDDEPVTNEDVASIEEARARYLRGESIPLDRLISGSDETSV